MREFGLQGLKPRLFWGAYVVAEATTHKALKIGPGMLQWASFGGASRGIYEASNSLSPGRKTPGAGSGRLGRHRAASYQRAKGETLKHKIIIAGSGCAGLTAAIYAARADLQPLVLDGQEPGGQLGLTTMVENFPGFPEGILGPELIKKTREQAERFGAKFKSGAITAVDLSKRPFQITVGKEKLEAEALVIAAGASARMLGLESEKMLLGHGVSTCATCDGYFYRDKEILVVGGGDTAMEEATFLTKFAKRVTIAHRRNEFRATKIMLDRARANPKIAFLMPYVVEEIHDVAKKSVEEVTLRNRETNHTKKITVDGIFVAIGHDPNTKIFHGQIHMDDEGYILTHDGPKASVEGVFAAGDVQDRHYRQAVTAAGSGCMAAIEAERFLETYKE